MTIKRQPEERFLIREIFEIEDGIELAPRKKGRPFDSKLVAFDDEARAGIKSGIYTSEKDAATKLLSKYFPQITDTEQKRVKIRDLTNRLTNP